MYVYNAVSEMSDAMYVSDYEEETVTSEPIFVADEIEEYDSTAMELEGPGYASGYTHDMSILAEQNQSILLGSSEASVDNIVNLCLLCKQETSEHVAEVSRGRDTFMQQCSQTGWHNIAANVISNPNMKLLLHGTCRRSFSIRSK